MEGFYRGFRRDERGPCFILEFELNSPPALPFDSDTLLSIDVKKWKSKRTLDANAYFWVLCSKIADYIQISKTEVYEWLLGDYGEFEKDDKGYISITVSDRVDMRRIGGHWKCIGELEGFNTYIKIKGSSEYNRAEMAKLIDGAIYECKSLGIETMPPEEIERMIKAWKA